MTFQTKDRIFLVMPAYNEEVNIPEVINQWYPIVEKINNESRLVIVDDGSKDRTGEIIQSLAKKFPLLAPLQKKNSGHGPTCLYAYNYAVSQGADWIFQTDSDGQTSPDDFWPFWEARNKFDFIIGNRENRQDGFSRILVTRFLKIVIWFVYGINIKDANTPFRLMKTSRLKPYLDLIPSEFFLSNVLISILIVLKKESHQWLTISFKPRRGGKNSINIKRIIRIGFQAIIGLRKIRKTILN